MATSGSTYRPPKKMAIITSYFKGETYGLLGPQIAATIIEDHGACECIVIAVTREDNKATLKTALADYFAAQRPIIGFSALSGREDLFSLAGELSKEGAITILAGPQANVDFSGERGRRNHPHRFKGFWECLDFGLQGPWQLVDVRQELDRGVNAEGLKLDAQQHLRPVWGTGVGSTGEFAEWIAGSGAATSRENFSERQRAWLDRLIDYEGYRNPAPPGAVGDPLGRPLQELSPAMGLPSKT